MVFLVHSTVGSKRIFFIAVTYSELSLKLLNFDSVVTFVVTVPLNSPNNLFLHLLVGLLLPLILSDELTVHIKPSIVLNLFLFVNVFLLHQLFVRRLLHWWSLVDFS